MLFSGSECFIGVNWSKLLFCPAKKVVTCKATSLWMNKKGAAIRVAVFVVIKSKGGLGVIVAGKEIYYQVVLLLQTDSDYSSTLVMSSAFVFPSAFTSLPGTCCRKATRDVCCWPNTSFKSDDQKSSMLVCKDLLRNLSLSRSTSLLQVDLNPVGSPSTRSVQDCNIGHIGIGLSRLTLFNF